MLSSACLFAVPIANRPRRRVIEDFGMRALTSAQGVFPSWIALTTTSGVCQLMHWLHTEALPTLSQFRSASHVEGSRGQTQLKAILSTSSYGDGAMQRMWRSDIPKC